MKTSILQSNAFPNVTLSSPLSILSLINVDWLMSCYRIEGWLQNWSVARFRKKRIFRPEQYTAGFKAIHRLRSNTLCISMACIAIHRRPTCSLTTIYNALQYNKAIDFLCYVMIYNDAMAYHTILQNIMQQSHTQKPTCIA